MPARHWFVPFCAASVLGCAAALPVQAPPPPEPRGLAPALPVSAPGAPLAPEQPEPRAPLPPPVVVPLHEVGTAHPALVVASAPDGRWVVLCQAREDTDGDGRLRVRVGAYGQLSGDRLQPYWVEGAGAGEPIRSFVASDPAGHYVAFDRGGRLILRDTWLPLETDLSTLGATLLSHRRSFGSHRAAVFSGAGDRLLYIRSVAEAREQVVVRRLADASEQVIEPGPGLLYRASFDASGERVVLEVVAADTNHNGRLEWPVPAAAPPSAERDDGTCVGPIASYAVWSARGDEIQLRLAAASGGAAQDMPGYVMSFGSALLRRNERGALLLVEADGQALPFAREGCAARVLHADPVRGVALLGCTTDGSYRDLELVGRGFEQPLNLRLAPIEVDWSIAHQPRLLPLYPGPESVLLDLETRQALALLPGDRVVTTFGERVLLIRAGELLLGANPAELARVGPIQAFGRWRERFPIAFVPPWVVDMAQGKVLGKVEAPALALSALGAALVPRDPGDSDRLPQGPLVWTLPR